MAGGGKHTRRNTGNPPARTSGEGPDSNDPCNIRFDTTLNAVDQTAIQNVSRGNGLDVVVLDEKNVPRLTV